MVYVSSTEYLAGEVKWSEKKGVLQYDTNLDVKVGTLSSQIKGYSLVDGNTHSSNLTLEYKWAPKNHPEKLKIEVTVRNWTFEFSISSHVDFHVKF